jgi:uncharacterized membrane protein YgdD (TMEM256/DUF423 family)
MRIWLIAAGLGGASSVMMGALGAHGLETTPERMHWYETAVMWHALHAVALAAVAALVTQSVGARLWLLHAAGALFVLGTAVFAGALYAMVIADRAAFIAPLGGLTLAAGWLALVAAALVRGPKSP